MADPLAIQSSQEASETEESLLEKILIEGRLAPTREERKPAKEWVQELINQLDKGMVVSKDTEATLNAWIAAIDEKLSEQLNEIMHAPEFQKLEGSWRGLKYLVSESRTSPMLKIKVFNVSKKDLTDDVTTASEFDQSAMFKKIHDEGFGTLGGHPFAMLVGDFEFGRSPMDMALLEGMAGVAAACHAPFLSAAGTQMFNWESYTELNNNRDLSMIFETPAYIRWKSFRESEDSRYVGLCLPHVLMRLPYGKENVPVAAFDFEEDVTGRDHGKYLWGNAAYTLAARVTNAFSEYEWCAAIRGVEGGGLVEGLPSHTFVAEDGDVTMKCPTEIAIPDRRENEFSKLGFIPLCYYKHTDRAAFIGTQSTQKPKVYLDDDANANANLSAQLQYIFAVSRFAHYLKAMMRDKLGSFMSREQCEKFLNDWISHFVLLDDFASQSEKARYPLRDARITVTEVAGKPGAYTAIAHLRPHFQLDELTVSLRLVAKLPALA
jgi:type VI secretion system protein ImpC